MKQLTRFAVARLGRGDPRIFLALAADDLHFFTDRANNQSGLVIYENEGVLFDRLRWGRIREHLSYEDTQRTLEFDRKLGVAAGA